MFDIEIEKKRYKVPPCSKLTFEQFNDIMIRGHACDLPGYLSIFTGETLERLRKAKLKPSKGGTLRHLHACLFDIDIVATVKETREYLCFEGKYISVKGISIWQFYQSYFFDLFAQREEEGIITKYQLADVLPCPGPPA